MKQFGADVLQYFSRPLYSASVMLCESVPHKFDLWRFWCASRLNQSKVLYDAYHYNHKNYMSIFCSLPQLHSSIKMNWYGIYPMTLLEVLYALIREHWSWNMEERPSCGAFKTLCWCKLLLQRNILHSSTCLGQDNFRDVGWNGYVSHLLVLRIQDVVQPLVEVAIRRKANIVSYRSTTQHCRHSLEN